MDQLSQNWYLMGLHGNGRTNCKKHKYQEKNFQGSRQFFCWYHFWTSPNCPPKRPAICSNLKFEQAGFHTLAIAYMRTRLQMRSSSWACKFEYTHMLIYLMLCLCRYRYVFTSDVLVDILISSDQSGFWSPAQGAASNWSARNQTWASKSWRSKVQLKG